MYCPFQSDSNHISSISKSSLRTAHIWSASEGSNALFIGLKISAKFLIGPIPITEKMGICRPIPIWWPIYHASLLFSHYICLHGYIHFIYLFDPNPKYRDMYRILRISQKYRGMNFCSYCPALLWRNVHLVIFCSVASEKPKALFFLTELMPFKLKYNSKFDNILVQNLNWVFQPFWQP